MFLIDDQDVKKRARILIGCFGAFGVIIMEGSRIVDLRGEQYESELNVMLSSPVTHIGTGIVFRSMQRGTSPIQDMAAYRILTTVAGWSHVEFVMELLPND